MNRIILLFIFCFWSFSAPAYQKNPGAKATSVKANLALNVSQHHLKADLQYQYVPTEDGISLISFYLTKDVHIDQLKGNGIEAYTFDRDAKPFATLSINFKDPLEKGTATNFNLSYSGILSNGFWTERYGWVDIDPDFMILPLFTDFHGFNYQLQAALDDTGYQFIDTRNSRMSSKLDISGDSVFYFESIVAANEIKFDQVTKKDYTITIISNKPDSTVQFIGNKSIEILDYFNNSIGQKSKINSFSVIYRPIPDSVFRTIRSLDDRVIMFSNDHERIPTLAHETAHFWWHRANDLSMEKWLDESFAEYSKLMYIRAIQGEDLFQKEINRLAQKTQNLPSILKSDRFAENWSSILYQKGPYLLYQLEETLGKEKFILLLSKLNEKKVSTTEAMLHELEEIASVELRNSFEDKLLK